MGNNAEDYQAIELQITDFAHKFETSFKTLFCGGVSAQLDHAMAYCSLGAGKRFRPFLAYKMAQIFGFENIKTIHQAGASLEMIHCYSLAHDDLPAMDDDDLRRGRPSLHKQYNEATAILAGDALQALAFENLTQLPIDAEKKLKLCASLAQAAGDKGMVAGQMLDIEAEAMKPNLIDLQHIQAIQRAKTGALIEASAQFGAILGDANLEQTQQLTHFAAALGEAFQITDDLLDHLGDQNKLGKAIHKDDKKGKVTFVTLLGIEGAKQRLMDLQSFAIAQIKDFEPKANDLNVLWHWLLKRDH